MSGEEQQLFSFFLYSMFVHPITNYLVSSHRLYPRYIGVFLAMSFLLLVLYFNVVFEQSEQGPNHYQILGLTRDVTVSQIKRAFRNLSLELHPDKNRDPAAVDVFNNVKQAHDVLVDVNMRQVYDHLGTAGVNTATQSSLDFGSMLIQILVHYVTLSIFSFVMTFSEASGEATGACYFGIAVMFLFEYQLVLEDAKLPIWILPTYTNHDFVQLLHRAYPAYMSGCRCILSSFFVDQRKIRTSALQALCEQQRTLSQSLSLVVISTAENYPLANASIHNNSATELPDSNSKSARLFQANSIRPGSMAFALKHRKQHVSPSSAELVQHIEASVRVNPADVCRRKRWTLARDLAVYLVAVYCLHRVIKWK